jgi:aryl-alcohol dehydrogenase-like predicted oxidoreductase
MRTRSIAGTEVGAIGLGGMPLSLKGRPPAEQAIATIHAALDAGITLIDTADAYCENDADTGHNERLIGEALRSWGGPRDEVLVATKGGHVRDASGAWLVDGRPEHLRRACDASLAALGVDVIDLYQFHRPDPKVPFAESIGAMAELRDAGKVRLVGVSNVDLDQMEEASAIVALASVQNQFSPAFRSSDDELAWCAARDIAFLPWSPLGGMSGAAGLADRFPAFADVAANHGVSPQQVALAWELAQADVVIPIPGASRPATIVDSAAAVDLQLGVDELSALSMDLGR